MNNGNGNGQGFKAEPQMVITELLNRIAALTMELAVKDAYIAELEKKETPSEV